MFKYQN